MQADVFNVKRESSSKGSKSRSSRNPSFHHKIADCLTISLERLALLNIDNCLVNFVCIEAFERILCLPLHHRAGIILTGEEEIKERGAFNKMKISVIRYLRRGVGTLTQQISIRRLLPPAVTIKELMAWKHSQVRSMKTKLTLTGTGRYSA